MEYTESQIAFNICLFLLITLADTSAMHLKTDMRTKPTNSVTIRQSGICTNHPVGEFVKNPADCKLFYLCVENGEAVMAACPPTMLFNSLSKLCDAPENVSCDVENATAPNNTNSEIPINGGGNLNNEILDASGYCASLPPLQELNRITFIGSSSSCRQYYICYYGQALLQECSANLEWNSNIGKCDLPDSARCTLSSGGAGGLAQVGGGGGLQTNIPNPGSNSNAGQSDLINCPVYGQHIFPHMKRCDYFIYCVKGHAILQQCPFYYHFDIVSKSCKWRTVAICVQDLNINLNMLTLS